MEPELGLYAVADGMGGHAAGEIASKRATEVLRQHILSHRSVLDALVDSSAQEPKQAVVLLVEEAIHRACSDIYRLALADPSRRGMGTTLVCLLVVGTKGVIGHVGDSRIYLCRAGKCHRLTEDHTLVAAQVKAGTLTKKQAATSQFRNVITRAVGIQETRFCFAPTVAMDTWKMTSWSKSSPHTPAASFPRPWWRSPISAAAGTTSPCWSFRSNGMACCRTRRQSKRTREWRCCARCRCFGTSPTKSKRRSCRSPPPNPLKWMRRSSARGITAMTCSSWSRAG